MTSARPSIWCDKELFFLMADRENAIVFLAFVGSFVVLHPCFADLFSFCFLVYVFNFHVFLFRFIICIWCRGFFFLFFLRIIIALFTLSNYVYIFLCFFYFLQIVALDVESNTIRC